MWYTLERSASSFSEARYFPVHPSGEWRAWYAERDKAKDQAAKMYARRQLAADPELMSVLSAMEEAELAYLRGQRMSQN